MSACMSKKILRMEEETMLMQKQGIVTILGSDHCGRNGAAAATSLRRTLSADMSSKKWFSQNELLSPMRKTASSEELSHSKVTITTDSLSSSEDDEYQERERFQIWSSIQQDKKEEHIEEKPGQFDIWSSILSQKANDETSKLTSPPYVHPLVRRSKSCLSEKSLEICTESLGSETGSDGFSSYPPSETGDSEEEREREEKEEEEVTTVLQACEEEELQFQLPKYNYSEKKPLPRCFPPPLSSLSRQHGPSLHMRPHRDNGRLFLQAVSVPSQNNFCAQRQDGRLVLTFASEEYDGHVAEEEEEEEEEKDHVEELEEDSDDEAEEDETVMEQAMISSVRRLALMMNKPIGLVNKNPKWSEKFDQVPNFKDVKVVQHGPLAQAYEYYWRTKLTAKAAPVPNNPFSNIQQNNYLSLNNSSSKLLVSGNINHTSNDPQQLLVLRGNNGDYLVHNFKSCKDSRRSFLFWEPYCIAT